MLVDAWHPVTKDLGLIDAPVDQTAAALAEWHAGLGIEYTSRACLSLAEALNSLEPLSAEKRRALLLPTNSNWTAFLQSGIAGSDPFPVMSFLSTKLGVQAMRVCATPNGAKWAAVIWEVYAPTELGDEPRPNCRRSVAMSNDGGRWHFSSSGTPYDFEEQGAYLKPRKRDRFTREMLERYLAKFDLHPFDDAFYCISADRPALLMQKALRWSSPPEEYTLEQVVAGAPWSLRRDA